MAALTEARSPHASSVPTVSRALAQLGNPFTRRGHPGRRNAVAGFRPGIREVERRRALASIVGSNLLHSFVRVGVMPVASEPPSWDCSKRLVASLFSKAFIDCTGDELGSSFKTNR